jgi:hypothetical protein
VAGDKAEFKTYESQITNKSKKLRSVEETSCLTFEEKMKKKKKSWTSRILR